MVRGTENKYTSTASAVAVMPYILSVGIAANDQAAAGPEYENPA